METTPLKAFATSARTELIREVTARITAVLSQGSPERVESPTTVANLEKAVAAGGGGDTGRAHVADKVAYTWFNRIIALRFMDANGYTGIGVVSPAADQIGQPEVLAAAKRGQIDKEVVSDDQSMTAIADLLNGTRQPRPGVDAQAEAYALLLAAYCRFWHRTMPFMFERQGDFTEMLIPANLLAGDSVLNHAVQILSVDVCRDVEVIGWLYQFYIAERKAEVFAGFKKNKKAGVDEIPAATQLFTPHWIVRYLVENSLGRLWMLNKPTSGLVHQMDYYIPPVNEETAFLKIARPEELTVMDPACGSGHMLTYAFDLCFAIYEEEGYAPSEIPSLILENNLYGTEIDPRAGALAAFALTMKAAAKRKLFLKNAVEPKIRVLDPISFAVDELAYLVTGDGDRLAEAEFWNQFADADAFGSLVKPDRALTNRLARHLEAIDGADDLYKADAIDRASHAVSHARFLEQRYAVVVANPPYMGRGAMSDDLSRFADRSYPKSKSDLFAMFIDRCQSLTADLGVTAMVTMQSWMFLPSLRALRTQILEQSELASLVHIGAKGFDSIGGEVVQTCAFTVWNRAPASRECVWLRLVDGQNEQAKSAMFLSGEGRHQLSQDQLLKLPNAAMAYWLPDAVRGAYGGGLSVANLVASDGQTKTGDNDRFLRYWWEVSHSDFGWGNRWVLHPKGGGNRRWFGNVQNVIDWSEPARAHYRRDRVARILPEYLWNRSGISWSNISTSASLGFRLLSPGEIFNLKAPTLYPNDDTRLFELLGFLNSPVASYILSALNPTISFNVNDVTGLPWKESSEQSALQVRADVQDLVEISCNDWNSYEETAGFTRNRLVSSVTDLAPASLKTIVSSWRAHLTSERERVRELEARVFDHFVSLFDLTDEISFEGEIERDTLRELDDAELAAELVSFAVGCMFGRYSLDKPGLILADRGSITNSYLAAVSSPTFPPDDDNVIPIVDGGWFEDDIVGRLRQFFRVAFGERHFEENLSFITQSLGVRDLSEFFITRAGRSRYYEDHVQRYKKRPIYWMFSSPKGSFNALIYLHRYRPSTASTVLTYLREYVTKLESSLQQAERAGNAKEADRLRKILVELNEYEHDTLYPKASENVAIDLNDGVKVNYPKLGGALRKIAGMESSSD
ncbi:restriction endonuclease [Mycobacterium sp. SWH-M1]|nr:restriction endonuclease [Mycobacterium sp. SWH-M1]